MPRAAGRAGDRTQRHWASGEPLLLREVYLGRVWAARPAIVVEDSDQLAAFYFPPGTPWKRPVRDSGEGMRVADGKWTLADATWTNRGLYLIEPGAAHAVHLWWTPPDWAFHSWYVNLQTPLRRTAIGFDYLDQLLDIVAEPDLSTWRWKDEEELENAVAEGLLSAELAEAVRAEGRRVIRRIETRQPPFSDGWELWQPDPSWPIPDFPSGWDAIELP